MAQRRDDRYRDERRRPERERHPDDDESYGQYGGLDRGLGYGGGRDIENVGRYGRGGDPARYPRDRGPSGRDPGDDLHDRPSRDRRSGGERGFLDRARDEVSSWFGDEAAQHRREADHRGKGPRGYRRSDERIRDDVSDRLTDDADVDATDIEVAVENGEVTLTGHVDSRFAKRRAEDCADSVSGVLHVQNNLRVRPPGDAPAPPPQAGGTV